MTDHGLAVPADEVVEWGTLFSRCESARTWPELRGELYGSRVLLSDYRSVLSARDLDGDELLETGTIDELRALLTEQVEEDRFCQGVGEEAFWDGTVDEILSALANRMDLAYVAPHRVLPCPTCGDAHRAQTVVFGMPAGQPTPEDEERYLFAGCVVDDTMGDWYCRSCESFYSLPSTDPSLMDDRDRATELASSDRLSVEELGQLYRDITLGVPTRVVLDTDTKRQQFLTAKQEVREIEARGQMVEIPE